MYTKIAPYFNANLMRSNHLKPLFVIFLFLISSYTYSATKKDIFAEKFLTILNKYQAEYLMTFNDYVEDQYCEIIRSEGSIYTVDFKTCDDFVRDLQLLGKDYYAYKIEQNFGYHGEKDKVAVITAVTNQFKLLEFMKIQGNDFEISNENIIKWFKTWYKDFKYRIIGIGFDFIQADIISEPQDYNKLAKEIYSMCPDVVDQGTETVKNLAKELKETKTLYFWWD